MPNCSESLRSGRAARCTVCDGKFGLVRHYSWRTPPWLRFDAEAVPPVGHHDLLPMHVRGREG